MKTTKISRRVCIAGAIAATWIAAAGPVAAQDGVSFAGRTVTATVGFEAGNRVDLYARLLGQVMMRYLPGQPNLIVMNRPGAGGVIALNDWVAKAEPNGLSIAVGGSTQVDMEALSRMQARYRPSQLKYIGGLMSPSQGLMLNKAAVARLTDKSAPPVTMGIVGSSMRTGYYQVLWGAAFLDWNIKWVRGYKSTAEVRNAVERGEVDMSSFGTATDLQHLLDTGRVIVASQSGASSTARSRLAACSATRRSAPIASAARSRTRWRNRPTTTASGSSRWACGSPCPRARPITSSRPTSAPSSRRSKTRTSRPRGRRPIPIPRLRARPCWKR